MPHTRMEKMNKPNPAQKDLVQPKRIGNLFTQRNIGSFCLSSVLEFLFFLLRLGIKPKTEGWRKYTAAFLRTEDSRFLLSVFRLKIGLDDRGNDAHINTKLWVIRQLGSFYKTHPQLWSTRLEWNRNGASIQPNKHLDFVWAEYGSSGKLTKIRAFFDGDQEAAPEVSAQYAELFIQAYNQTVCTGRQRPYHLMKALRGLARNNTQENAIIEFGQRILDSVFIHFESMEENGGVNLPDFSKFPHPGGGAFNILCRLHSPDYDEVDLWFHINHVLHDGNPVLEAITGLKRIWGTAGAMVFTQPAQDSKSCSLIHPFYNDSGRELVYAHQQISFEHLLKERERLNQKYGRLLKNKITIAGMILWGLSSQPFLKDCKLTLIIDVLPDSGKNEPRTLGFVTTEPNDFLDEADRELSFVKYQVFLNDAVELARKREDQTYVSLKSQALTPVTSYEMTQAMVPNAIQDIGGKISLTIMPLADYCAPPADDTKDAIIAIGNIMMPAGDGKLAGAVCIKSIKEDVNRYWESVYNTISDWHI